MGTLVPEVSSSLLWFSLRNLICLHKTSWLVFAKERVLGGVKSFWEEKDFLRVRATDMWAPQAAVWKGPQAADWVTSNPTRPLVGKLSEQPHKDCGPVSILSSSLIHLSVLLQLCSASTPPWEDNSPSAWASCLGSSVESSLVDWSQA